jgi:hypothetical protein
MTYAINSPQQNSSATAVATLATSAAVVAPASSTMVVWFDANGTASTYQVSDGTNTYSYVGGNPVSSSSSLVCYISQGVTSGSYTPSVHDPNSISTIFAVYAYAVSGVATSGGVSGYVFPADVNGPGLGANALTTGNFTVTGASAILALAYNQSQVASSYPGLTAGTTLSWNSEAAIWATLGGGNTCARGEDISVSSTASYAATWGTDSSSQFANCFVAAIALPLLPTNVATIAWIT